MAKKKKHHGHSHVHTHTHMDGHHHTAHHNSKHTKHGSGHQANTRPKDMTSLVDGHGNEDPLAHESHCETNEAFGMHAGLSPEGCYHGGQDSEHGGEGMAGNAEHYD